MLNNEFENKVALLTGAASGIGLTTATAFAEAGAAVVITDINERAAHEAADALQQQGFRALGIRCDVTDEASVAAAVQQTVTQ